MTTNTALWKMFYFSSSFYSQTQNKLHKKIQVHKITFLLITLSVGKD